ncbi:MAG: T9SS type A sorting domain-containing protein, partial [Flavobacteriales bacterium]
NLVGNPYPSAISATALVNAAANSSVIDGALYFWNDDLSAGADFTSSDYAVWNGTGSTGTGAGSTPPDGNIASCQGFMVRALGPGAISFNNSMRVGAGNNGLFFRPAVEPAKIWLSVTGDNTYNEILVGMLAEATDSQDRLYDALKLNANPMVSLSAVNDGDDFAIMAFPHPQQEKVIPLNLLVGEGGTHTFQAHTMLGFDNYTVYLEDNLASTLVELTEGVEVQADVVLGDNPDRFYLHFVPNLVTGVDETLTSELRVYGNLDQTFIDFSGNQTAGNLEVLSANGQLLFTQEANLGNAPFVLNTRAYAAGVYIVKFTTGNKHHVARFSKF